jgi:hypothetical protein
MIKNILFVTTLILILTSCKSYLINNYFKSIGVYDAKIKLEKLSSNDKEIVLFGMHHIGKNEFYEDVKSKIDSLKKLDYLFYIEGIKSNFGGKNKLSKQDSIVIIDMAYKFRKISGKPLISKNLETDHLKILKDKGIKVDYNLVQQPSYSELGISPEFYKNTDLKVEELLEMYENKYGKIILESCDYNTKYYENSICKNKLDKNLFTPFFVDERNNSILRHITNENKNKIAIIYGKEHFIGVKDSLQKLGYIIVK